jgi:hypothetical protein
MSTASAAPVQALTCSGGQIHSGTYSSITVTGDCTVKPGANVVVQGNVTIAPGASFDGATNSTIKIRGNVIAGAGSSFALGCTPAHPCDGNEQQDFSTTDKVGGDVVLNNVFNAALNGDRIAGDVVVNSGGAGLLDPEEEFIPFSIKDDKIGGNVIVNGLTTVWFGVIRSNIGGNVILTNIHASDPDANEVVANKIGGNLICSGDTPAPQFGDAILDPGLPPGYGPNRVRGHAIGQCADLTHLPV